MWIAAAQSQPACVPHLLCLRVCDVVHVAFGCHQLQRVVAAGGVLCIADLKAAKSHRLCERFTGALPPVICTGRQEHGGDAQAGRGTVARSTSVTPLRSVMPRGLELELTSASMKRKMYPCSSGREAEWSTRQAACSYSWLPRQRAAFGQQMARCAGALSPHRDRADASAVLRQLPMARNRYAVTGLWWPRAAGGADAFPGKPVLGLQSISQMTQQRHTRKG